MDERPATKVTVVVLELLELADGDKKRENSILHEGFSKLGASLTVVLVCFAYGFGVCIYIYIYIYIYIPYPTSTSDTVLIDVAPFTSTIGPN
jgi:hypothetical protein